MTLKLSSKSEHMDFHEGSIKKPLLNPLEGSIKIKEPREIFIEPKNGFVSSLWNVYGSLSLSL